MLTRGQIAKIRGQRQILPRVFVETGTWYGGTTERAIEQFPEVHTIERDPLMYATVAPRLTALGARCVRGDSAVEVPRLALAIQEPVFWFLDAHWFDVEAWGPRGWIPLDFSPLPLWQELAAIAARPYADVIVVDDADDFGTTQPTPEWASITPDQIARCFDAAVSVFENLAVVDRRC